MTTEASLIAILIGAVLGIIALVILARAARSRKLRGFESGDTFSLDDRTLFSERLMLVGRPDRIVQQGRLLIPEEWKSSRLVYPAHRLQLAVYFLLIEERFGVRPPHGFVVLSDGSRVRVENTEQLRSEVLSVAEQIRRHRRQLRECVPATPSPAKCRACGQRAHCDQARV